MSAPERSRTALITGVSGQDGVLLARHLAHTGTTVVGTVRPGAAADHPYRVYLDGVRLVEHEIRDDGGFRELLRAHRPDHVYNLASFSSVGASWNHPDLVAEINGAAVERMLAVVREHDNPVRFFQASSAEELSDTASPYAEAKRRARAAVAAARDAGIFACAGILFNHESPLRQRRFVTRKVTMAAAETALGKRDSVTLGNLDVCRDWGAARDYVEAMALMLDAAEPADLQIGTGRTHSLRDLVRVAFDAAGVDDAFAHVTQDPALLRPTDPDVQRADPAQAREELGWEATTTFEQVIGAMVTTDLERLRTGVEESPAYLAR